MAFGYNNPYNMGFQQPAYNPYSAMAAQQQAFQQPQMSAAPQSLAQPTQQPNGAIWVQGEVGAKSYLVSAGNTVILWDSEKINSEKPVIYIKSADAQGVMSMQPFELTPISKEPASTVQAADFVTRKEFDDMKKSLDMLLEKEEQRQARFERKQQKRYVKNEEVNNG